MTKLLDDLDAEPILIPHKGRLAWLFPSGRIVHDVRGADDPDPAPKTFTQEDVDRIVEDRLKRAKVEAKVEPPADYEQFKNDSKELARLKAATQTDADRLKAENEATASRIAKLEEDVRKANEASEAATAAAREEKRISAIVAAAGQQKAANPNQVAALLAIDAVTIGDDGQVTGADEAVKKFLTDNPHFVGTPAIPKPDRAQGKQGDAATVGAAGLAEARKRFGNPAGQQQQQ